MPHLLGEEIGVARGHTQEGRDRAWIYTSPTLLPPRPAGAVLCHLLCSAPPLLKPRASDHCPHLRSAHPDCA